jgi:hypothetical protein
VDERLKIDIPLPAAPGAEKLSMLPPPALPP